MWKPTRSNAMPFIVLPCKILLWCWFVCKAYPNFVTSQLPSLLHSFQFMSLLPRRHCCCSPKNHTTLFSVMHTLIQNFTSHLPILGHFLFRSPLNTDLLYKAEILNISIVLSFSRSFWVHKQVWGFSTSSVIHIVAPRWLQLRLNIC